MTTEAKPPSVFARGESGARQLVLQLGLGVVSFIIGSMMAAGLSGRLLERLGPVEGEAGLLLLRWGFERFWLFVLLPAIGYVIGRLTDQAPLRFALLSGLAGETFSLLLVAGINGFDFLVDEPVALAVRGVTLAVGIGLTALAVRAGRAEAVDAQAAASASAASRKAEYVEYLAKLEGKAPDAPPAATPGAEPPA